MFKWDKGRVSISIKAFSSAFINFKNEKKYQYIFPNTRKFYRMIPRRGKYSFENWHMLVRSQNSYSDDE